MKRRRSSRTLCLSRAARSARGKETAPAVRAAIAALLLAAMLDPAAGAAAAAEAELLYFEVGTVWTGAEAPSSPGGLLVRDGKILHVGPPLKVAQEARTFTIPGGYLVPAFIDAHTWIGTKGAADRNEQLKPIYPEFKISDSLEGVVLRAGPLFEDGLLRAYISPGPRALVGGVGAVLDAGRREVSQGLLTLSTSREALCIDREPMALSGLAILLREQVPAVCAGRAAIRIFAREPHEVELGLAFAKENKVRAVLVGVERPDLIPDLANPSDVIVIPRPTVEPSRLGRLAAASERGVRLAFGSWAEDVWHVNVRFLASLATAYGVSHEAALRALTVDAAEACGMAGAGTLAAEGRADFAVFGGDPLDLSAPLLFLVAGGEIRYKSEGYILGGPASAGPSFGARPTSRGFPAFGGRGVWMAEDRLISSPTDLSAPERAVPVPADLRQPPFRPPFGGRGETPLTAGAYTLTGSPNMYADPGVQP